MLITPISLATNFQAPGRMMTGCQKGIESLLRMET